MKTKVLVLMDAGLHDALRQIAARETISLGEPVSVSMLLREGARHVVKVHGGVDVAPAEDEFTVEG